jgi:hypothetical protein
VRRISFFLNSKKGDLLSLHLQYDKKSERVEAIHELPLQKRVRNLEAKHCHSITAEKSPTFIEFFARRI